MEGDRDRALVAGCDGYIPKPIDVDRLPHQVAEFLSGKREEIVGGVEEQLILQQEYSQELVTRLEEKVRELQKANIELRRTDELKSKFISIAAHELRTPITVVQGYLTMLLDSKGQLRTMPNEALQSSVQGITTGIERLHALVEEMLYITQIEAGTLELHRKMMVVKDAITAAVRKLTPATAERGQTVMVEPMEGLPYLRADAERLHHVFLNLMSNAIKFTPDGGEITVSAQATQGIELSHHGRPSSASGEFVDIVFADTGIGIDPEEQERIFAPFYEIQNVELHSTSKTRFLGGGLGVGLVIARGIVEAHGGKIWAESPNPEDKLARGSKFTFILPKSIVPNAKKQRGKSQ